MTLNQTLRHSIIMEKKLSEERAMQSFLTESLKKLVSIAYNRFEDDFTLDELEALERAADLIGDSGIALAVRNRIEKGNYV